MADTCPLYGRVRFKMDLLCAFGLHALAACRNGMSVHGR